MFSRSDGVWRLLRAAAITALPAFSTLSVVVAAPVVTADTALDAAFRQGTIAPTGIEALVRQPPKPGWAMLAGLNRRVRGLGGGPVPVDDRTFLPARILLETDPIARARLYREWGALARSAAVLKSHPAALDRSARGWTDLVETCLLSGDTAAASAAIEKALAEGPPPAEVAAFACAHFRASGRLDREIALLEDLAKSAAPGEAPPALLARLPHLHLEMALRRRQNRAEAYRHLNRALALDSTSATVWYNVAVFHSLTGQADTALRAVQECLERKPDDYDALLLAASIHSRQGRRDQAAAAFRRAIDHGAPVIARKQLALLLLEGGDLAGAAAVAAEAFRLDPHDPRMARTHGVFCARGQRWEEALPALEAAHRAYPHDNEVRYAYAEALVAKGRCDEALKVVERHPDPALRLAVAARAHLVAGRTEEALCLLRPRRERGEVKESYLRSLSAAADQRLASGDLVGARTLWFEWLRADSAAEVPRRLIEASATRTSTRETVSARSGEETPSLESIARSIRAGQYSLAENRARHYVSSREASVAAWNLLALAQARQGKKDEARASLDRSLALDPAQSDVRAARAELAARP